MGEVDVITTPVHSHAGGLVKIGADDLIVCVCVHVCVCVTCTCVCLCVGVCAWHKNIHATENK